MAPLPTALETERLRLRRPCVEDAAAYRRLWAERDPRVPPHRRLAADGSPSVEDIADELRAQEKEPNVGLLTVVRTHHDDVIGYCGLILDGRGPAGEPELAYELLARSHGHGYATEAASAVLAWAAQAGYGRVWAGVRRWNTPSLRVLSKLAFVDTGRDEPDAVRGDSAVMVKVLIASPTWRPARGAVRSSRPSCPPSPRCR